jgi:ParB family transcriptional regulator, chromosome partitioning protein
MPRKTGLGRGLDALIPSKESSIPSSVVSELPVERISPNPRQPRSTMDSEDLADLAASIREHGVLQPLIVTEGDQPGDYVLVAGERRWLAARQVGLEMVPVVIRDASQQELLELALVENVQRADLSPVEAAQAFHQLADEFGLSHEEIATRVGKSRVSITNTIRLLKLPEDVRKALVDKRISEGHARALLALPTPQAQSAALYTLLKHDFNVRQTEELVRQFLGERPVPVERPAPPPEMSALEERLRVYLGTKVSLKPRSKGGTLVIHYYSNEELDGLLGKILNE